MRYLKELRIEYVETDKPYPVSGNMAEPDVVCGAFREMENFDKERMIGVYLNTQLEVNCYEVLSVGSVNFAAICPKELFKGVLLTNSSAFMLLHNHPSGSVRPSTDDRMLIETVRGQAELMQVHFMDFLIIGTDGYWSMREEGYEV